MRPCQFPRSSPCLVAILSVTVAAVGIVAQEHDVPSLHLVLIDEASTDCRIVDTAMHELDRIWGGGHLRVVWTMSDDASDLSPDLPLITIVIRPSLAPLKSAADQPSHRGAPLGRLRYDDQRHVWNRLDVSLGAATSTVMASSVVHMHVTDLPLSQQRLLVGRALGRVIAHEIGHWACGPMHSSDGLMKPQLAGPELIDPRPPALPARCSP